MRLEYYMYTNKTLHERLYKEKIKDPFTDKRHPLINCKFIVVDTGEEKFISADIIFKPTKYNVKLYGYNYSVKTYDFYLELFEKKISEDNICDIRIFLPDNNNIHNNIHNNIYNDFQFYSEVKCYHPIFEVGDLNNMYMVFYKDTTDKNGYYRKYDISIYKSFNKIIEIHDVNEVFKNGIVQSFDLFSFSRTIQGKGYNNNHIEKWVFHKGNEIKMNELDISFYEWCRGLGCEESYYSLESMYSKDNEINVESNTLKWNDSKKIKWKCEMGHEWYAPIRDYTLNPRYYYCPICISKLPILKNDVSARNTIKMIKEAYELYNINDINELKKIVSEKYMETISIIDKYKDSEWIDDGEIRDIKFYFVYPNGIQGDINMYVAENYGVLNQIYANVYEGIISSEHKDLLLVISGDNLQDEVFQSVKEKLNNDISHRIIKNSELSQYFMEYNIPYRIEKIKNIYLKLIGSYDYKKMETVIRLQTEKTNKKRKEIYNSIMMESKSSSKWVSEQKLYRIIKYLFEDSIYQYKAGWLQNQSLDIYIPSIKVGVEYQGEQHYKAIDFFGGQQGLANRQMLDEKKRKLCKKNKIELIEWKFDEPINEDMVKEKMKKWIKE